MTIRGESVRSTQVAVVTLRAFSARIRLCVALVVGLAACSGSSAGDINSPAVLGPFVDPEPRMPLPVESLPAIYDLDLSQPVAPESRKMHRRIAQQIQALRLEQKQSSPETADATEGPMLRGPDEVSKDASAENATEDSPKIAQQKLAPPPAGDLAEGSDDDLPPEAPDEFKPEWRSTRQQTQTRKSERLAKSFTLPIADATAEDDNSEKQETVRSEDPPAGRSSTAEAEPNVTPNVTDDASETENTQPQVAEAPPAPPLKPLTRNQIYLRNKLRRVLGHYYRKPLNSRDHDAWEAMHGMLAYGLKSRIRSGGPRGESMTAIGWLCYNNPCKRKQLMRLNDEGKIRAQYGVGLQGHMGQFLAMLAQCNVDKSYPIRVAGKEFTIEDLIEAEQETCYTGTELTFKLIGLMHYLPSDTTWLNDRGETWSIERLIAEELKQPVRGAACGGTHRLGGLSLAVKKRQARGEPVDGEFLKAAQFSRRYEQYAYRLQNSDGSFSTEWFRGPGRETDINRRCRTSGHLLEWILYQCEPEQLTSYRVVKGTNYLTNLLYQNPNNEWETGPLCHALHALVVYDKLVFQPHDANGNVANTASKPGTTASSNVSAGQRGNTVRRNARSSSRSQSPSSARRGTGSRRSR